MISILPHGQKFAIVLNAQQICPPGNQAERVRTTFEKCWTGDAWAIGIAYAKLFDTYEEANLYRGSNLDAMRDQLGQENAGSP